LVVANGTSNTISVLLGNGDGTFQPHVDYAAGMAPASVAAGDFNGDGKLDLAIASYDNTLSILLGNGDGTFQAPLTMSGQNYGEFLAVGDFNGDGKLDLAVGNYGYQGAGVQILLGNGNGTFTAGSFVLIGEGEWYDEPTYLVARDFNRDGKADLALVTDSGDLYILLGKGDGTFQTPVAYPTGADSRAVATGDFNGDGILDLATANFGTSTSTISILLGNGDGTFQTHVDYPNGQGLDLLTIADINGDGALDLAVANPLANTVSVLLGNGDGTFQESQVFATGNDPFGVAAADFNGDGRMDLAVVNDVDNDVSVLLQVPAGSQPAASVSTNSLTFSGQNLGSTSGIQGVTLNNTGGAALAIAGIVASGDFAQTNTCGSSVAAGGNCTINVTFTPTAAGPRSGSVIITDNSSGITGSTQTVTLSGTGLAPQAGLSPSTLTFAALMVGSTSASQPVILSNSGGAAMTLASIAASGDFAQTNTCGSSVAAGANCTINVTFTPTEGGGRSGAITVTDNASGTPHTVSLAGTGEDFTISLPSGGSPTATVAPGALTTYPLSFGGLGGMNQTVNFTCTGAPSEATCTVNPASATPGASGSVSVTVTVTTTAASAAPPYGRPAPPRGPGRELPLVLPLLVALLTMVSWGLAGGRRIRQSLRWAVALGAVAALVLAIAACGGGGGGAPVSPSNPGTPAGTYTLTITGTAGSGSTALHHSTTLTLNVT
jgi:hypothetical protein